MSETATIVAAFASVLVFTSCATAPSPTAADDAFAEFHARMMANYPAAPVAQSRKATVNESVTETNQNRFALPPPFLQLPEQRAAREEVEKSGVAPALVEKMLQGQILALAEIQELVQHKMSDTNLVKYLRSTGGVYALTTKQIDELRAASVSNEVLDYLLATPSLRRRSLYSPFSYYHPHSSLWDHHYYGLHHYDHHFDVRHH